MVRKLDLIILMFISMFLISLPLYAREGGGRGHGGHGGLGHGGFHTDHFHHHHHHHGHFEEEGEEENFLFASAFFFNFGIALPFVIYPYYYPYYSPYYDYSYEPSYGDLKIEAIPEEVEIFVDGRFIGRANDYKGAAVVLVPSGTHVVDFRYKGLTSSTKVSVAPDTESFVGKDFRDNSKNQI